MAQDDPIKKFEELKKLAKILGKDLNSIGLTNAVSDTQRVKDLLAEWTTELIEIRENANDISSIFHNIMQDSSTGNVGLNNYNKSFRHLVSMNQKIQSHMDGVTKLNIKQIEQLKKKSEFEKKIFESNLAVLKNKQSELLQKQRSNTLTESQFKELTRINKAVDETTLIIKGKNKDYEKLNTLLSDQLQLQQQSNKNLGLSGVLVDGIGKSLNKLGFGKLSEVMGIDKAKEKMNDMASMQAKLQRAEQETKNLIDARNLTERQIRAGFGGRELKSKLAELDVLRAQSKEMGIMNGKTSILKAGFKEIGKNILTNLKDPLVISGFLITQMIKALKSIDEGAGKMAKSMNITYSEALNVREELTNIANSSGDTAVNTQRLQETMLAVNAAVGARVNLNEKDLITFTKLREQAGLSNEQLMSMAGFTAVNGKSLEKNMSLMLKGAKLQALRNNQAINEKQIMEDINQSSTALQLSLGASTEKLAQAAVNARKFGLTLSQTEKIAESMLNFESSIENELSAELLLGRDINLEKARGLALNGDTAAAATEIAKQMGSAVEFGRLNVIQQEAMAKAAGMNREELAKSLKDKELLSKFGKDEVKSANEAYQKLVETYGVEEARRQVGDDALANMYEQQSLQERFNDTVAKLQEIFVTVGNALMPIFNLLGGIMDMIGYILVPFEALSSLAGKLWGPLKGISAILLTIGAAALLINSSLTFGLGTLAVLAGVGYGISKFKSMSSQMNDGEINKEGKPTLFTGKDMVKILPEDSIYAAKDGSMKVGTDLLGNNKPNIQSSPSINVNMNKTNALLQKLITTIEKGGNVTLDGQKVGRALKLGAYKTN